MPAIVVAIIITIMIAIAVTVTAPPSAAIVSVTTSVASVDLYRRDAHVPVLTAVVGNLKLAKVIDIARGRTTHAAEVCIVEELDACATENTDRAYPIVQARRNGWCVLTGGQTERLASKVVIDVKASTVAGLCFGPLSPG
jgi:hypothetical protein